MFCTCSDINLTWMSLTYNRLSWILRMFSRYGWGMDAASLFDCNVFFRSFSYCSCDWYVVEKRKIFKLGGTLRSLRSDIFLTHDRDVECGAESISVVVRSSRISGSCPVVGWLWAESGAGAMGGTSGTNWWMPMECLLRRNWRKKLGTSRQENEVSRHSAGYRLLDVSRTITMVAHILHLALYFYRRQLVPIKTQEV